MNELVARIIDLEKEEEGIREENEEEEENEGEEARDLFDPRLSGSKATMVASRSNSMPEVTGIDPDSDRRDRKTSGRLRRKLLGAMSTVVHELSALSHEDINTTAICGHQIPVPSLHNTTVSEPPSHWLPHFPLTLCDCSRRVGFDCTCVHSTHGCLLVLLLFCCVFTFRLSPT